MKKKALLLLVALGLAAGLFQPSLLAQDTSSAEISGPNTQGDNSVLVEDAYAQAPAADGTATPASGQTVPAKEHGPD